MHTAKCGGTWHSPTGTIMSPNYPGAYESNMDCEYRIVVGVNRRVVLSFDTLNLKKKMSYYDSTNVTTNETYNDVLIIYDVEPMSNRSTSSLHFIRYSINVCCTCIDVYETPRRSNIVVNSRGLKTDSVDPFSKAKQKLPNGRRLLLFLRLSTSKLPIKIKSITYEYLLELYRSSRIRIWVGALDLT